MGFQDPKIRVGTSGTTLPFGRNYANTPAVAGFVFTATGDDSPPDWAPAPSGGAVPINKVLFADAINGNPGGTGNPDDPVDTIQGAVDQAVLNGWTNVLIQAAPGIYNDTIDIDMTVLSDVVIQGYNTEQNRAAPYTTLQGDITCTTGGGAASLQFVNCDIEAANILTADTATQDLGISLINSMCSAYIEAANLILFQLGSVQWGDVTGVVSLFAAFDGPSWTEKVAAAPAVTYLPATYTRYFVSPGVNTFTHSLTTAGPLNPNATAYITQPVPDVRAGDYAILQALDVADTDFIAGFHSSSDGNLIFWLQNTSVAPKAYNVSCQSLVFHAFMVAQPAP